MKLAACSMLTLLVACSTQTEDLGHTVTTHGFGATRWEVGTAGVLRYVAIDVRGDVVVASDGAVEKRSGADGSKLWSILLQSTTGPITLAHTRRVTTDLDGNIIVVGRCQNLGGDDPCMLAGVDLAHSNDALFVLKLDPSGAVVWAHLVSPQTSSSIPQITDASVTVADDGRIFVATNFESSFVFPNGTVTNDSSLTDGAVIAIDPDGHVLWGRAFQGSGGESAHGPVVLANGDLMVTGALTKDGGFEPPLLFARPSGRADQWIARLDRNGVLLWQHLLDVPADLQSVGPMARLPDGRAAVSFTTLRADTEVVVPWAAIVDDDGEVTWQSTPTLDPAPGGKPADGLAARPDGTLILAGGNNYDRNVVDLGTGAVENHMFAAAYDPTGATGDLPVVIATCAADQTCQQTSIAVGPSGELAVVTERTLTIIEPPSL